MKFAELRQGDVLLSLEQDRRGFPYCDMAQIQRISAPTTGRIGNEGHYQQIVDMTVSDSMGTYKITVPADAEESIYERIYYTTNPRLIVQGMNVQKSRVKQILDNTDLYKAIYKECDNIIGRISQTSAPSENSSENDFSKRLNEQGRMLEEIYSALFNKKGGQGNENNQDNPGSGGKKK